MAILDQIQTIVIVMFENRSFDNVLGHLSMGRFGNRPDLEGLVDPETNPDYTNFLDSQGYQPFESKDGSLLHDLPHPRARRLVAAGRLLDVILHRRHHGLEFFVCLEHC